MYDFMSSDGGYQVTVSYAAAFTLVSIKTEIFQFVFKPVVRKLRSLMTSVLA